jgi:hypothetical protein
MEALRQHELLQLLQEQPQQLHSALRLVLAPRQRRQAQASLLMLVVHGPVHRVRPYFHLILSPHHCKQGYSSTFGDGGRTTIDGGTSGASYVLLDNTGSLWLFEDFIVQNNGATGSAALIRGSTSGNAQGIWKRVTAKNARGDGFLIGGGTNNIILECEAYNCNLSNTATMGGFNINNVAGTTFIRCYSHGHTAGANGHGFLGGGGPSFFIGCIADSNSGRGFHLGNENARVLNCDAYNNGLDGIGFFSAGGNGFAIVENCNLVKNGTGGTGYGINCVAGGSGSSLNLHINNCGFGSGTQANASGTINSPAASVVDIFEIFGTVTYPANVTPWVDPTTGNFSVNLAEAKNSGRAVFLQTENSKTGTVGYPDIGAAMSAATGLLVHPGMSGGMI